MKIIKEGKLPDQTTHTVECPNCHTVFEFEHREGVWMYSINPDIKPAVSISCPLCNMTYTYGIS